MTRRTLTDVARVAVCNFAVGAVMVGVFAILGYFDLTVLWGALLGNAFVSLNFLWIGFTVERSVAKDPKKAQQRVSSTYVLRLVAAGVMVFAAIKLDCFNMIAAIIPLFYQRFVISAVGFWTNRRKKDDKGMVSEA